MMNLCLIDCYLNRGVMCLIWEGAEPPASLVRIYWCVVNPCLWICNGPLLPPPVSRSILKCTTRSDLLPPLTPPSPSSTPDELLRLRDLLVMRR